MCSGLLSLLVVGLAFTPSPSPADDSSSLEARCRSEVVELHRFLEAWSNAELPSTDEAFSRFEEVIAPSFVLVDPDGETLERESIVTAIRTAHGRWSGAPGRIRIENVRLRQAGRDLVVATYEEWHDVDSRTIGRSSTVVFGRNDRAPNGLEWLHLHESWIAEAAPPAAS